MLQHPATRRFWLGAHRLLGRPRLTVTRDACGICGERAGFQANVGDTLWREATCAACGASLRNADVARVIVRAMLQSDVPLAHALRRLEGLNILEGQAEGPIHRCLKPLSGYTAFEYWEDVPPGAYRNGVMSNDFERLSFDAESFDLIISQDVFEHVADPHRAFAEIARVLKPGGAHIFTVPVHEGRPTLSRAGLAPVAHPDPLRVEVPVFTDWGEDLPALLDRHGLTTTRHDMHRFYRPAETTDVDATYEAYRTLPPLAYYRYNSIVFVSRKPLQR